MKKRVIIAAVVLLITMVPAWIMLAVTYVGTGQLQGAAFWASLPAVAGLAVAATAGRRFAVIAAIVVGLLAPLSIVAGSSPVSGAALMALMAMTVGRLSRFGLHKSALLYPVMLAWPLIAPPTWSGATTVDRSDTPYLLWMAAIFFVGAVLPALVVPLLMRKRPTPPLTQHSRSESVPYTVVITVLLAVSTFIVLDNPRLYGGAFLIAAILVLAPIGVATPLRDTFWRILGTLIGSVLLLAVLSQIDSLALIYLLGLVFIVIALMSRFGVHGWLYYVFMVPATAALNATTLTQVGQLGEQRLVDNIVGGVLVLIGVAATIAYSHWATRHGHADAGDAEADALVDAQDPAPASAT